ncbi:TIGR01621 family pseudouridine synthase [Colwellia psychrerythraea]|uniref:Pseudouridine synthase Rlu family protein, TIGR01621 n=1 Tax=Colwellia psychrerythraea TaxID=28229 RepID=A0A099L0M1_COLPS|nr:TIGR01621 family pseudouridine synthase [Colwellia psychrerythraea]KGJ95632.1 pseudouridine synthase Rlu family protein, TIGR01621 [Colwellia psychrerythraea]
MYKTIAEHHDFIVVDKGTGVNFHDEGDIGSGLFSLVKKQIQSQNKNAELYPVHRLDKMTSGLVIFAKSLTCAQIFGQLFNDHDIEKYYLAIGDKKPSKKQGLIKGDMAKSRRGMFKLLRSMENPAITQFFSYSVPNKQRLYLLKPHSGKTHQLRVALASIGAPIVGDPLYYTTSQADRGYLHAFALKFTYLGECFEFTSLPSTGQFFATPEITHQFSAIKKPWRLNWPRL